MIIMKEPPFGTNPPLFWHEMPSTILRVSGGMIFPEDRRFDIPIFFPGLFFRLFS
jgi:hypothetical protein